MIPLATCINDLEAIGQKAMSVADDKDLWLEREKEETGLTRRSLKMDGCQDCTTPVRDLRPQIIASVHRAADLHFDAGERETKMTLCKTTRPR